MPGGATSRLITQIIVDNSKAIPASKAAGDALAEAGRRAEEANRRVAEQSKRSEIEEQRLAAAMRTRLSASKEVDFAMQAQAAAGKPLLVELVNLREQYARLEVAMRRAAAGGQGVPTVLTQEAARIKGEMARVESAIAQTGATARPALGGLSVGFLAAGAAAAGLVKVMKDSVASAQESEANVRALTQALAQQGRATEEEIKRVTEYSTALEKQTNFSDDSITRVQTMLIEMNRLSGTELQRATKATLDYATAMGKDLNAATLDVSKGLNGHAEMLQKLGIQFTATGDRAKDLDALMTVLNAKFGGQASAAADTYAGKVAKLANQWDNVKEIIGGELIPVLSDLFDGLGDGMLLVQDLANSNNVLVRSFVDIGSLGIIPALRKYREWKAELKKDANTEAFETQTAQMKVLDAQIGTLRRTIDSERELAKGNADAWAGKIEENLAKVKELEAKRLQLQGEIAMDAANAAGGYGPIAQPDNPSTKKPKKDTEADKAARDHAELLQRVAAMRADAALKEAQATDGLSLKIAQLENERDRELAAAKRETDPGRQDALLAEVRGTQEQINALKKKQEADKAAAAEHQRLLQQQIAEVSVSDPLKQKIEDLRLARLQLAQAILAQKGATGELTAEDRAHLYAIDAQIEATQKQIEDQARLREAAKHSAQEMASLYKTASESIAKDMGTAFGTMVVDSNNASTAMKKGIASAAQTILHLVFQQMVANRAAATAEIGNQAAIAGSRAISSTAGMGPLGLPIGLALAEAFIAAILSEKRFLGAAKGGTLRGGIPGQDSIPVMAMQDETFLDTSLTKRLDRALAQGERAGSKVVQTSGRNVVEFHLHAHAPSTVIPATPHQAAISLDQGLLPAMMVLAESGKLKRVLRAAGVQVS